MREILFRGKREDNGAWVYGSFIPDLLEVHHGGPDGGLGDWGFIKPFEKDENGRHNMVYVQRNTVGQYTGLTDKTGKKIFEGDIVRHYNRPDDETAYKVALIFFDEKITSFRKKNLDGIEYGVARKCVYQVIGNRWDDPELLEF